MADMMTFPETWEEFEKSYGFDDSEEVYTNGSRLVPSFRVKQWLDHIAQFKTKRQATVSSDCISRQDAIVNMAFTLWHYPNELYTSLNCFENCQELVERALNPLPSAQSDRDIPKKPKEETDTSLGCRKIPVCPECDRHLSFVAFIESGKGKKITYCEHCGQAIDWEGWVFDE